MRLASWAHVCLLGPLVNGFNHSAFKCAPPPGSDLKKEVAAASTMALDLPKGHELRNQLNSLKVCCSTLVEWTKDQSNWENLKDADYNLKIKEIRTKAWFLGSMFLAGPLSRDFVLCFCSTPAALGEQAAAGASKGCSSGVGFELARCNLSFLSFIRPLLNPLGLMTKQIATEAKEE